jgi:hypothetical protein
MKFATLLLFSCTLLGIARIAAGADESTSVEATSIIEPPQSIAEARSRAKLLHEMIRGTLQVVHRDFFDEDNAHAIPSSSLEDVFHEMQRGYDVELKWLTVNTDVVNVDHQAEGEFELQAVKKLASGSPFFEAREANRYRFAGAIRLRSQCLKCHVKRRTSNDDRTAGLLIAMPLSAP